MNSLRQQGILEHPLSRFPLRGQAGAGGFPPRRLHAARQQKAPARIDAASPPARGISNRSAEIPLAHPPNRLRRKESLMACGSKEPGFFSAGCRRPSRIEIVERSIVVDLWSSERNTFTQKT